MKRIFASFAIPLLVALGIAVALPTATVFAGSKDLVCQGANTVSGATGGANCAGGASDLNNIIETALNLFSIIIGIIAVVMLMVGGFKYITAGGDSGNITSAKHTIIYALIGIVVVALAQVIVQFVLDKATN